MRYQLVTKQWGEGFTEGLSYRNCLPTQLSLVFKLKAASFLSGLLPQNRLLRQSLFVICVTKHVSFFKFCPR